MKRTYINIIILLITSIILSSCFKTDIDKISDKVIWNPNISIAAGTIYSTVDTSIIDTLNIGEILDIRVNNTLFFNFTNMADGKDKYFKSMMFRINMTNEYPVSCEISMFYNDTVLLYPNPIIIDAGKIDNNGISTIPSNKSEDIIITDSKVISEIINIKHFIISVLIKSIKVTPEIKNNLNKYRFKAQLGTQMQIYVDE